MLNTDTNQWTQIADAVASGEKQWDDFSILERTCRGWLLMYLWQLDPMFGGRWAYWFEPLRENRPPCSRIPRIDFLDLPNAGTVSNLRKCLEKYSYTGARLDDFMDWLLWGFGEVEERARISEEINEYWYRTFNMGLLMKHPYDYWGLLLSESKQGFWNNPNAFYPTPHSICKVMSDMTFANKNWRSTMRKTVCDPCVGSGRMLMYASNHSLRLYGQDLDHTCIAATKINGYLYVPWLVKPAPDSWWKTKNRRATKLRRS